MEISPKAEELGTALWLRGVPFLRRKKKRKWREINFKKERKGGKTSVNFPEESWNPKIKDNGN